jgi:hypothetical protein
MASFRNSAIDDAGLDEDRLITEDVLKAASLKAA